MDALKQFFERTVKDAKRDEFFKGTYETRRRFFVSPPMDAIPEKICCASCSVRYAPINIS